MVMRSLTSIQLRISSQCSDIRLKGDVVNVELVDETCYSVRDTLQWLECHGVDCGTPVSTALQ